MTQTWAASQTDADLFSRVHRAVCHVFLSCQRLLNVVRPGNINLYSEAMPNQPRPVATTADLPEMKVYPSGLNLNGSPSDGNHYTQLYTVETLTGDSRIDKGHNQIKEAVLYAINRARVTGLALPRNVLSIRCINYAEQLVSEEGRPDGWSGVATLEIRIGIADWEAGL